MSDYIVYIDLDGVLADFDLGVIELANFNKNNYADGIERDNVKWQKIAGVPHFYDKLKLMPGAKEMFDLLYNNYHVEILTGIPKPKRGIVTAGEDKTNWSHRELNPDVKVNICYKEDKYQFCTGLNCILIDDTQANIDAWVATGGTGILYTNPEDVIEQLKMLNNSLRVR